jgi:hypothetical protein
MLLFCHGCTTTIQLKVVGNQKVVGSGMCQSVERCKHVKSQANTDVFQARQVTAGIYICTTCVGNNRSRDGRGGKPGRNRWCATTGPPQTLRRQAQRLSRFGGRAARSGRLDAEEVVVGGAVGGKLDGTCRGRPAMSAAAPGPVAPAQRGVPCAAAVEVARASSAT